MKYRVGDVVRVREDLNEDRKYGHIHAGKRMVAMSGQLVTIAQVLSKSYEIKEDRECFYWTDEMFEDVEEEFKLKSGMVAKSKTGKIYLVIKDGDDAGFFGLNMDEDGKIDGGQCDFQDVKLDTVWQPRITGRWSSILRRCNKDTQVYPKKGQKRIIVLDGKTIELSEESYQEFKRQFAD